jgi:hypothetical protein
MSYHFSTKTVGRNGAKRAHEIGHEDFFVRLETAAFIKVTSGRVPALRLVIGGPTPASPLEPEEGSPHADAVSP